MSEYGDSPPRYPYLVTPLSVSSGLGETAQLIEDVDMDIDNAAPNDVNPLEPDKAPFLVIDTNILVNNLYLVRDLYRSLGSAPTPLLHLLIPSVVINELDGLARSQSPAGQSINGDVTVGDLAKSATRWLLETKRSARKGAHIPLRTQRWAERQRTELEKADDKILDCCLYFGTRDGVASSRNITLWTNDRNLSLLAETNDIPTIGGPAMTLQKLFRACSLDIPVDTEDATHQHYDSHDLRPNDHESMDANHDMELDVDLYLSTNTLTQDTHTTTLPGSPYTNRFHSSTSTHSSSSTPATPLPPLTDTRRSASIPQSALSTLTSVFHRVLTSISPSNSIPQDTRTVTRSLYDTLTNIESQMTGPMNEGRFDILRSISSTRTILTFLENSPKERRPRTGELADALVLLAELLYQAGLLPEGKDKLYEVAAIARSL